MRLGIDIGGTKAVIALVDEDSRIVRRERVATGSERSCRETIALIARKAAEITGEARLSFVGIGVPGTVDRAGSRVCLAPNLHWRGEPVADYFEKVFGQRPFLAQDTRAAAWAEARTPQLKGKRCVICITLGTGIGCGIVMDGKIYNGALGTAGEIGHIPIRPGGRACSCGRHGCMEAYASGTGIAHAACEQGLCTAAEDVFTLAGQGNQTALTILDEAVTDAAAGITAAVNLLSPDALVFSGGMAAQETLFVRPLIEKIKAFAYQDALGEALYIGTASLGADAPVVGAAFLDEAI